MSTVFRTVLTFTVLILATPVIASIAPQQKRTQSFWPSV